MMRILVHLVKFQTKCGDGNPPHYGPRFPHRPSKINIIKYVDIHGCMWYGIDNIK